MRHSGVDPPTVNGGHRKLQTPPRKGLSKLPGARQIQKKGPQALEMYFKTLGSGLGEHSLRRARRASHPPEFIGGKGRVRWEEGSPGSASLEHRAGQTDSTQGAGGHLPSLVKFPK